MRDLNFPLISPRYWMNSLEYAGPVSNDILFRHQKTFYLWNNFKIAETQESATLEHV
jgi:hypothetical protein